MQTDIPHEETTDGEAAAQRTPALSRSGEHRLVFANQLRGLAALSVVFGHMIAVYWGARDVVAAFTATPLQLGPPSALYPFIVRPWLNLGPLGVAVFVRADLERYQVLHLVVEPRLSLTPDLNMRVLLMLMHHIRRSDQRKPRPASIELVYKKSGQPPRGIAMLS